MKTLSRQRLWQIKHKRRGLCTICSNRLATKNHCLKHAIKQRELVRRLAGAKRRNRSLTYRFEKMEKIK